MNATQPLDVVSEVLRDIAPEVELGEIDEGIDLRTAADLDSIDFLNLVTGIHVRTGIDIPERDYEAVSTLRGLLTYLADRL